MNFLLGVLTLFISLALVMYSDDLINFFEKNRKKRKR
jgi:hypothetical protein